jgi:hypothetical protein
VRHATGNYDLRQIPARPHRALIAIRAIRVSPFSPEAGLVCFAGYDANKAPARDTAWIVRGASATPIGGKSR